MTATLTLDESPRGSPTHASNSQGSNSSSNDYASQGFTGIIYFAIGGTLLLLTIFWINSDFASGLGDFEVVGQLVEYAVTFIAFLLIGFGLHGMLKSATH
jgi:apolipoprotein N-acyltransferase